MASPGAPASQRDRPDWSGKTVKAGRVWVSDWNTVLAGARMPVVAQAVGAPTADL
jgi:hypothetical protein